MTIWLIGLAAVLYLVLTLINRRVAVALFVALLPVYLIRFAVPAVNLPSTLLEVLFGALFLGWIIGRFMASRPFTPRPSPPQGEKGISFRPWANGLCLLMVGGVFGVAMSQEPLAALGLWRAYFLEPFLFFLIFVDVIRDARARRMVLAALCATVFVVGVVAFIQKLTGWWIPNPVWVPTETRRVTAFYGFPNGIGLMAAPITILLAGWTVHLMRKIEKPLDAIWPSLTGLAAIAGMFAILFAVSEGAMIGLAVGLVVLGLAMKPLRKITEVAVIIGCVAIMAYAPLRNYTTQMITMSDDSWAVRKIVWMESLDMLYDRPVWGAGLSGYPAALEPYHQAKHIEIFQYPHNFILNFWSETGLVGVVGFLLLIWTFFKITGRITLARTDQWLPAALIAAMLALLIHGLVDVPYFKNDLAMLFFVLLGLAESMRRQHAAVDRAPKS